MNKLSRILFMALSLWTYSSIVHGDIVIIDWGGLKPSYLGPASND
jgi:hypothetical protein